LYYPQERKKVFREISITRSQNELINQLDQGSNKLIVFIVPGLDWNTGKEKISGGIMSIVSLYEETLKLKEIHGAEVIMCTLTSDSLLLRFRKFENEAIVFRFSQVIKFFGKAKEVIIHLPEFMTGDFKFMLSKKEQTWLTSKLIHYNILNQNIRLCPSVDVIYGLVKESHLTTMTTAHSKYCNSYYREYFNVPLHKFSTWVSPEKYQFRAFNEKNSLLVVSPDGHPMKDEVLERLRLIEGLSVVLIQGFTYEQYKELISKAKWSLTFGEGLDGYFVEPIFSGSISFAIYNEDFFTPDFAEMQTVYHSFEDLLENIANDILRLDNSAAFENYQKRQYDLCAKHYNQQVYRQNISEFYRGNYTFE
jgi:hypothetical protein